MSDSERKIKTTAEGKPVLRLASVAGESLVGESGAGESVAGEGAPFSIASIPEVLEELRNGRFVILLDDADRENEADLVVAAQMCGPERINFMATHGRGLICLALESAQVQRLNLPLMTHHNRSRHETAFTVSVEARKGVSTGISASDRARTVAEAIRADANAETLISPGHIFPLMAREGGVLTRAGHTEAGVDLSRLAGLAPAAVICEIMDDDGSMARGTRLVRYAERHGIKIATIADLIAWRVLNDRIVERVADTEITTRYGRFRLVVYRNRFSGMEHAALVRGTVGADHPTRVRVHAVSVLDDLLGPLPLSLATSNADSSANSGADSGGVRAGTGNGLDAALRLIATEDQGVVVLIREEAGALSRRLATRQETQETLYDSENDARDSSAVILRDYGEGAQILLDLGVRKMCLLHHTQHTIVGLAGYGLEVVAQQDPLKA